VTTGAAFAATVQDALRRHWTGRHTLVIAQRFTAADHGHFAELAGCGITVRGVVTAMPPTGDAPPVDVTWNCSEDGTKLSNARFDAWLAEPPEPFVRWLSDHDPDRRWAAIGTPFTHIGAVCGRPVHGWRRPQWAALEDKTVIEDLWAKAGVPSPQHVTVPADDPGLAEHVRALDRGLGVVLAMDSSDGFLGDAKGLRWVRNDVELAAAVAGARTRRWRAATFTPGVPCSVLALVLRDGVAVFDPIEIVTLRDTARAGLVFCGSSTWWRPDPGVAAQIRRCARQVGTVLADTVGYRGMFSVDGILGPDGFVATEMNPRHSSGLGLRAGLPGFPLYMFQRAVQEGVPGLYDLPPDTVEDTIRAVVREHPSIAVQVPQLGVADGSGALDVVTVDGDRHTVRHRASCGAVRLDAVEPVRRDGTVAPAAAALATALGPRRLDSFLPDGTAPTRGGRDGAPAR
jgi:hypothetical protein